MCTLKVLPAALCPSFSFSTMSGSPAIARNVGSQSWCWTMLVGHAAGCDPARPAHHHRHAESAFPIGVLLAAEGRHRAVRPGIHVRAVVRAVHHEGVIGDAQLVEQVQQLAHVLVMVDHRVVIGRLPAAGLAKAFRLGVGPQVHVRGVDPAEERFAGLVLALDEVLGGGDEVVVAGLHALLGERAGVLDLLFADPSPARLLGRVVLVRRPAVQDAARPESSCGIREVLLLRVVGQLRFLFGVEVVEVAEELVEAMHGRQVLVAVAEVVLAELAGGVALRLQELGDGRVFGAAARPATPGKPTLVRPVRKPLCPVMNEARPAVQVCSP